MGSEWPHFPCLTSKMYLPNGSVLTVMTPIIPNYSSKHKRYNQTLYFPTFPLRDPDTVNTSLVPPHQFFCIKMWLWLTLLQVQYFWLPWDPPFSTIASTQCIEYVIDWDNHAFADCLLYPAIWYKRELLSTGILAKLFTHFRQKTKPLWMK